MRSRNVILWMASGLLIAIIAAGVSGADRPRPPRRIPSPASGPPKALSPSDAQMNRLQIDAFELTCTAEELAEFDLDGVTRGASTAADLLKKLKDAGTARILFRVDEQVNPADEYRITSGSKVPTVQDVVVSKSGTVTPSVTYQNVGYILKWRAAWQEAPRTRASVAYSLEVSNILKTSTQVSRGVVLPMFTETNINKNLVVNSGVPVYSMASCLPEGAEKDSHLQILIVRMVVTRLDE